MSLVLQDLPSGPLDKYRQLASFDWKQLKQFLYGDKFLELLEYFLNKLKHYPEFCGSNAKSTPSLSEVKRLASEKMFFGYIMEIFKYTDETKQCVVDYLLHTIDPAVLIKGLLAFGVFPNSIQYLGTDRHIPILEKALKGEVIGCFGLTEIAHGSNTKALKTFATYDIKSKEFILHSPNFKAAKCWIGLLGHTATYATVMANLITPDGIKRGVHAFLVPIRDPNTLIPYPGITSAEMGEKIGLDGIDNGLIMFNKYRISRESLLNRLSDVAEDGTYHSKYKDANKRHGALFGNLSSGRISIVYWNTIYMSKALTIAIRYSAVRKQFGLGDGKSEIPILEYQTHQYRLLPYLAANYCMLVLANFLIEYRKPQQGTGNLSDVTAEVHALSSAAKPIVSWLTRDAIQECREACGGHGYLKAAGIGALRKDQDASPTFEGANHVLLQQTSKWLLKFWHLAVTGKQIVTPLKSIEFLNNIELLAKARFNATSVEEVQQPQFLRNTYQWLVYFLLKRYSEKYTLILKKEQNAIIAQNNSQVFVGIDLVMAYIEHVVIVKMAEKIKQSKCSNIKEVLTKLLSLYGLWSLQKHISTFYIGGYATGSEPGNLIQEAVLKLCSELKNEAVSLVDVVAPPDFILNSVLGYSDGQVYNHLEDAMVHTSRPDWWKEVVYWKDHTRAKL